MALVIGVKFRNVGKLYYFDPGDAAYKNGDNVIVETSRGLEYGFVGMGNSEVDDETIVPPLRPVIRLAAPEDTVVYNANREKEKSAFSFCRQKIIERGLDMKLVDVEYAFDGGHILFYFTADERVDFRELVKDLAVAFHTRIELRQIGVRDESKILGGIGTCGQPFCCSRFLFNFQPVSIRMAKDQGKSLNPTKISGTCGRLMCCLKYEQDVYEELSLLTPRVGAIVKTADGEGLVTDNNVLAGTVKIKMSGSDVFHTYKSEDVTVIGGKMHKKKEDQSASAAENDIPAPAPADATPDVSDGSDEGSEKKNTGNPNRRHNYKKYKKFPGKNAEAGDTVK